ncbi:MAG: hypothetical protein WBA76_20625 [Phormidesmis sp.]
MTERLDRIEALLLTTAERQNEMNASLQQTQAVLNQTAQQQATNTTGIDDLLGVVVAHETELQRVLSAIAESNQRFEILRQEAISDRSEWQSNFSAQMEIMRSQLLEMSRINRRLDNLEQAS